MSVLKLRVPRHSDFQGNEKLAKAAAETEVKLRERNNAKLERDTPEIGNYYSNPQF